MTLCGFLGPRRGGGGGGGSREVEEDIGGGGGGGGCDEVADGCDMVPVEEEELEEEGLFGSDEDGEEVEGEGEREGEGEGGEGEGKEEEGLWTVVFNESKTATWALLMTRRR